MIKLQPINSNERALFWSYYSSDDANFFSVGGTANEKDFDWSSTFWLKEDGATVGYTRFGFSYHLVAWFSLYILKEYRDQKRGRAAFEMVTGHLFENLEINSINHNVAFFNKGMRKIISEYGCRKVGELRNRARADLSEGKPMFSSTELFELTRDDYHKITKRTAADSIKSYGIDDEDFLESEKKRLLAQQTIQKGPIFDAVDRVLGKRKDVNLISDLGCGVGDLVSSLASKYPKIRFQGVDITEDFIDLAQESKVENVEFVVKDFLSDSFRFNDQDVVLLKMTSQHLGEDGLQKLFTKIREESSHSVTVITLDVDDRLFRFVPEIPGLSLLLHSFQRAQVKYGGDREIGLKTPMIAEKYGLKHIESSVSYFDTYQIGVDRFDEIFSALMSYKLSDSDCSEKDIQVFVENYRAWRESAGAFATGGLVLSEFLCD